VVVRLDLNADMGESFGRWTMGDDSALLPLVTSANVACGFHAGDPSVLLNTCREAARLGVVVGAHVSYQDLSGFGRTAMDVPFDQLHDDVLYQLAAIWGIAKTVGARLAYVKPHGALYNRIASDADQARAVISAMVDFGEDLALVGLSGSQGLRLAEEAGLRAVPEAFADRAYNPDGTLVSRRLPGSVLHGSELIARRMVRLAREGLVEAADGSLVPVEAESICVHGDTPGAVENARAVRVALRDAGIDVRPFVE